MTEKKGSNKSQPFSEDNPCLTEKERKFVKILYEHSEGDQKKGIGLDDIGKQLYSSDVVHQAHAVSNILKRIEPKLTESGIIIAKSFGPRNKIYLSINAKDPSAVEKIIEVLPQDSGKENSTNDLDLESLLRAIEKSKLNDAQKRMVLERLRTPYIRLSEPYEPKELRGITKVCFGVVSDTHINSQFSDWGILSTIYEKFAKEGVLAVFHCGDITDGEDVYPGQSEDLRCFGWEETLKLVKKEFPKLEGVNTYFIMGKHDSNYLKRVNGGVDIGRLISAERDDLVYIAMQGGGKMWVGDIKIGKNTHIKLLHPNMAASYAISYPTQKIVDSIEGGKKPQILLIGGFHKYDWLNYRDIEVIQAGTTQHQTPYMLSKKWFGSITGIIVEAKLLSNGELAERPTVSEIPFYD